MHIYRQTMIFVLGMALTFLLPHVGTAQTHGGRTMKGKAGVHRSHAPSKSFKHGGQSYGDRSFAPRYDDKSFGRGDYYEHGKSRYRSYEPSRSYEVPYDYGKRFVNPRGGYNEYGGDFGRYGYDRFGGPPFNQYYDGKPYGYGKQFGPQGKFDRSYDYFSEFPSRRPPKTYGPQSEFPLQRPRGTYGPDSEFPLRRPRGTYGPDSEFPLRRPRGTYGPGSEFPLQRSQPYYGGRFDHPYGYYPGFPQQRFDRGYGYDRNYPQQRYDRDYGYYRNYPQQRYDRDYGYDRDYPQHQYDWSNRYYKRPQPPRDFFSVPFRPGQRHID